MLVKRRDFFDLYFFDFVIIIRWKKLLNIRNWNPKIWESWFWLVACSSSAKNFVFNNFEKIYGNWNWEGMCINAVIVAKVYIITADVAKTRRPAKKFLTTWLE